MGAVTDVTDVTGFPEMMDVTDPERAPERTPIASPSAEPSAERAGGWIADVAILILVTIPVAISLARHRLWRDELQAWAIATSVQSFGDLFRALRYEGHPPLWYGLLIPTSRVIADPRVMQAIALTCFIATALIVLRLSPWRRGVQVLLLAGYFPMFEYSAIARSYTVGLPLTVGLCAAAWPRQGPRRYSIVAALACALALTSLVDGIVAGAIVLGILVDELGPGTTGRLRWERVRQPIVLWSLGAATLVVGVAWFLVRPASNVVTAGKSNSLVTRLGGELSRALIPIPDVRDSWWNTSWAVNNVGPVIAGAIAGLMIGLVVWSVRRSTPALVTIVSGTLMVLALGAATGQVALRLGGHILLAIIAGSWCYYRNVAAGAVPHTPPRLRAHTAVLWVVLGAQLAATVVALPQAWSSRFSGVQDAAEVIRSFPADTLAVVEPEGLAGGVAGVLGRAVYVPSSNRDQHYAMWDDVGSSDPDHVLSDDRIIELAQAKMGDRRAVLILDHPFRGRRDSVVPMFSSTGTVVPTENVYVYRIRPTTSGS